MEYINKVNRKISIYINRNFMLSNKYFSIKSLKMIYEYYQSSRLFYGMCVFIDKSNIMMSLERLKIKFFKSIIKVKKRTSRNRLKMTLNLPNVQYSLFPRLISIIRKYYMNYGEKLNIYDNIIKQFIMRIGEIDGLNI